MGAGASISPGEINNIKETLKNNTGNNKKKIAKIVNKRYDQFNNTYLQYAIISNDKEFVELLIKNGADVNSENYAGLTPLYYAEQNEDSDIVTLLKNKGAISRTAVASNYNAPVAYVVPRSSKESNGSKVSNSDKSLPKAELVAGSRKRNNCKKKRRTNTQKRRKRIVKI